MEIGTVQAGAAAQMRHAALKEAAEALEASFLSEMLQAAGLGAGRAAFGGGAGEDHFASLLTREQARVMVEAGGIGLSEVIFEALKAREDAGQDDGTG